MQGGESYADFVATILSLSLFRNLFEYDEPREIKLNAVEKYINKSGFINTEMPTLYSPEASRPSSFFVENGIHRITQAILAKCDHFYATFCQRDFAMLYDTMPHVFSDLRSYRVPESLTAKQYVPLGQLKEYSIRVCTKRKVFQSSSEPVLNDAFKGR